jgi:hypothetical protein
MLVAYPAAVRAFESLQGCCGAASLHPYYLRADASRDAALEALFFVHEEGGELFYHGFHKAQVPGTSCSDIQSPYGYSGPLSSSEDPEFLSRAWGEYRGWCRESGVLAEFIRFHPALANWRYYLGEVIRDRETVLVDLTSDDLLMSYGVRARTAVRKAQKLGLTVTWCDPRRHLPTFSRLYRDAMTELGAESSYYFAERYFRELLDWTGTRLALCSAGDEILAAALFLEGKHLLEYHLSASTPEGKKSAATNLILHEAAQLGKRVGCRLLHLGGGTDPREENALLFFKTGFSRQRGEFRIGKYVHDESLYLEMKREWEQKHPGVPSRILFYRF